MPKNINAQQVLLMSVCCLLFCLQPTAVKSQNDQWTQLFNGKDLSGWQQVGKGTHVVENGLIRSSGGMGLLYYTKEKFRIAPSELFIKCKNPTATPACLSAYR